MNISGAIDALPKLVDGVAQIVVPSYSIVPASGVASKFVVPPLFIYSGALFAADVVAAPI